MSNDKKIIRRGDTFRSKVWGDRIIQFVGVSHHWTGEDWVIIELVRERQKYEMIPARVKEMEEIDNIELVNVSNRKY